MKTPKDLLIDASKLCKLQTVEALLKENEELAVCPQSLPLIAASKAGDIAILNRLLQIKAVADNAAYNQNEALIHAANQSIFNRLLELKVVKDNTLAASIYLEYFLVKAPGKGDWVTADRILNLIDAEKEKLINLKPAYNPFFKEIIIYADLSVFDKYWSLIAKKSPKHLAAINISELLKTARASTKSTKSAFVSRLETLTKSTAFDLHQRSKLNTDLKLILEEDEGIELEERVSSSHHTKRKGRLDSRATAANNSSSASASASGSSQALELMSLEQVRELAKALNQTPKQFALEQGLDYVVRELDALEPPNHSTDLDLSQGLDIEVPVRELKKTRKESSQLELTQAASATAVAAALLDANQFRTFPNTEPKSTTAAFTPAFAAGFQPIQQLETNTKERYELLNLKKIIKHTIIKMLLVLNSHLTSTHRGTELTLTKLDLKLKIVELKKTLKTGPEVMFLDALNILETVNRGLFRMISQPFVRKAADSETQTGISLEQIHRAAHWWADKLRERNVYVKTRTCSSSSLKDIHIPEEIIQDFSETLKTKLLAIKGKREFKLAMSTDPGNILVAAATAVGIESQICLPFNLHMHIQGKDTADMPGFITLNEQFVPMIDIKNILLEKLKSALEQQIKIASEAEALKAPMVNILIILADIYEIIGLPTDDIDEILDNPPGDDALETSMQTAIAASMVGTAAK